jgi:Tol biopolymer transport system component
MKLRRILIAAIIAAAATTVAATGSASPVASPPTMGHIAYSGFDGRDSGFDVMLANTNGSDVKNITHDGTAKVNTDPNWSANGMKVAYTSYSGAGADIVVVDSNGKGYVNLTPSFRKGILNIHPTWSPDGSIVFASNRDGNFDLYRIRLTTSTAPVVQRMTRTDAPIQNLDPDYSANGRMLVFSRTAAKRSQAPTASLLTMRATPGATPSKLTWAGFVGTGDLGATWSPNGQKVAFYSDRNGNNDLYVVNRDGSGLIQLTWDKSADSAPSWSPDGTQLVFLSDRSGGTELWMTSLLGLNPTWQITFDKGLKGAPDWQPYFPVDPAPTPGVDPEPLLSKVK